MKKSSFLLLSFIFILGCETHRAEIYQKMYSDYVRTTGNGQSTYEACSFKVPNGGTLPQGFEFKCNAPVAGYAGSVVQPPQYPPASPGWAVLETIINRGASVATFGIGADVIRSIVNKAVDGAGHNISGSYNRDSHDVSGSYNTDRHDINDSYNDRHDINDSYNDRHDINDSYNDRHDVQN